MAYQYIQILNMAYANPGEQLQEYVNVPSTHVASFWQKWFSHSSVSSSHKGPKLGRYNLFAQEIHFNPV